MPLKQSNQSIRVDASQEESLIHLLSKKYNNSGDIHLPNIISSAWSRSGSALSLYLAGVSKKPLVEAGTVAARLSSENEGSHPLFLQSGGVGDIKGVGGLRL